MPRRAKKKVVERADPETWYGRVVTSVGRRRQRGRGSEERGRRKVKVVDRRGDKREQDLREQESQRGRARSAGLLNGVRDKKQIRFTHSRFPLANSISSGVPLTLCP